ncbi:hypothetical protein AVEN_233241-1 [Araneus ventricosus]|uniref:Uncharacterized protein n=1 Tax=Araneus ventricosus TaxID=182803 RepID=A0A4Y2EL79_ARAVE|nr:hypothetical protein AVEN_233241-1 [Araneus ventricosus]
MRGQYAQAAYKHMMKIGCIVDYVRSGGMRNAPVTKAVEHLYAATAKFSGTLSWPHVLRTRHVGYMRLFYDELRHFGQWSDVEDDTCDGHFMIHEHQEHFTLIGRISVHQVYIHDGSFVKSDLELTIRGSRR